MRHCSLDIECIGPTAVVSIGAVMFNPYSNEYGGWIEILVKPSSDLGAGEVAFWLRQNDAARRRVSEAIENGVAEKDACEALVGFFETHNPYYLWTKPPTYDERIIREMFKRNGVTYPLDFRSGRDVRTLLGLGVLEPKDIPREGVHHNACDDAKHQARQVTAVIQHLKKAGVL